MNLFRMKSRPAALGATVLFLGIVVLIMCAVAGCAKKADSNVEYYCPMHPTYVSDRPGDCPICNMKLEPRPKAGSTSQATPSGTPSASGGDPAAASADQQSGSRRILFYRNPMDPSVTSPVPMKDPMGMDYIPVYEEATPSSGVEGYSTVNVSDEGIQLAGIQTVVAEEGILSETIRTIGEVKADETRIRQVSLKNGGWVERLYVNFNGQTIRRGQPLLSIYSPELLASENEYLQAREAARQFSDSDLPEVRRGGQELLDAARRRLTLFDVPESFIKELERTGRPQRTVTLTAPVSGSVTGKEVYEGSRVEPGMLLFTISDLSRVWIEGDIYENEVPRVKLGQTAGLGLTYDPNVNLSARVSYIYPFLNPETRTVRIRFDVDNPNLLLKPGMFANVELAVNPSRGVKIPESAILDTGTRQIVYVETSPGRFEPREVKVGARSRGMAQILSGVGPGERAVVNANFLLDSESRLRSDVVTTSPAAGPSSDIGPVNTPGAAPATGAMPDTGGRR